MKKQGIDFDYLLLEHYKMFSLSEEDLAVLMMMAHLIDQGNTFITGDLLALKMSLDAKKIDNILASFVKKKYIEFVSKNGKTVTSLEPLEKKLFSEYEKSILINGANNLDKQLNDDLSYVISIFEMSFDRKLSPLELSTINDWLVSGESKDNIINALKNCYRDKNTTIKEIESVLISWKCKKERESEGISTIDDKWKKDLEETIRIAKTPWLDIDDEK